MNTSMLFFKRLVTFVLLAAVATNVYAGLPTHDSSGQRLPSLSPMLKQVNPAVVNISTYSEQKAFRNPLFNDPFFKHFFGQQDNRRFQQQQPQKRQQSAGSGVIVDAKEGIVMTNYHVIKNADEVKVSLTDGRVFEAKIVGSDPDLDIAILEVEADNLREVKLTNSDNVEVGDFVVAIGNPFGLGQTVTTGVVSALGRSGLGLEGYENFIQTDASINPGNSGGALVNLAGELVGINTAIIAPAGGNVGIGFAIPTNMAKASMDQILEHGEVRRGMIGIGIQNIDANLRDAFELENGQQGVLVSNVNEDSPADKAGIESGDIIIAIDDVATNSTAQLRSQIGMREIGDEIEVTVLRDGRTRKFDVEVGKPQRMAAVTDRVHSLLEGAQFEELNNGQGVQVVAINPNSRAAYSGLRTGDIIVGANRRKVTDMGSFEEALARNKNNILLRVNRRGGSLFIVIQ